ncbi:hypothetical protein [Williamsoniiplasma lucivorax]|uniref:Lipoprotein n=1 Tax=Williamsoniiplasma lucivorax TaxID=209274 RepID=A0A2S5R9T6_9MOLU|nr:hypothetical protein [Williamsoniiplasma lucivorax]PPE04091.1 hypothetical protein ELUCI_v1c08710 [Williamsoniiplasma lucivorax]
MKKLLTLLGSVGMMTAITTTAITVVSCTKDHHKEKTQLNKIIKITALKSKANLDGTVPSKGGLGQEVEPGVLIQAIIDTNADFTNRDGHLDAQDIHMTPGAEHTGWSGTAIVHGVGDYEGTVTVSFTLHYQPE